MAAMDKVKKDILDFFAQSKAQVGHVFNAKAFQFSVMNHYNPKEMAAVEDSVNALVVDGLVEERQRQYHLTQKGFDHIYA